MARFDAQAPQQSGSGGYSGLALLGAGAGGAAAGLTIDRAKMVASDAKVGKWASLATAGVYALAGNSAQANANSAMASVNSVAGTNYATDIPAIKASIQQLAVGLGNLNPLGYLGISTQTAPLATPSSAAPAPAANNGIALVALVIAGALLLKD